MASSQSPPTKSPNSPRDARALGGNRSMGIARQHRFGQSGDIDSVPLRPLDEILRPVPRVSPPSLEHGRGDRLVGAVLASHPTVARPGIAPAVPPPPVVPLHRSG